MTPAERLARLGAKEDPSLVAELQSGYVVLAQEQYLRGYCLLLAKPLIGQLNDLESVKRAEFLQDMSAVGDAVKLVTGCRRINYGIYGNVDPFLHAHIWPRFENEDPSLATLPPLSLGSDYRNKVEFKFSVENHGSLIDALRDALDAR